MTFTHKGRQHQLTHHPRHGANPPADAALGLRMVAPSGKRGWHSLHTTNEREAIRRAKDLLDTAAAGVDAWMTHAQINERRAGLTLGSIIDAYLAAGCPRKSGMEWLPRTGDALTDERRYLATARPFWAGKAAAVAVHESTLLEYLAQRGHAARSVELEKNALSNACRYAISLRRITENPFAGLGNIRDPKNIVHCYQEMPASADELHALIRVLFATPATASYGAHLLFQAFSGLRPGEPGFLLLDPAPGELGSLDTRTINGHTDTMMNVRRLKGGISPYFVVHPALTDFLAAWRPYVRATYPGAIHLFPHPREPHDRPAVPAGDAQACFLDKALKRAAAAIGIKENRRPHAMRAYCGAVLLAKGHTYAEVAEALGEKTGEKVILDNYSNPKQYRGNAKFDWLPPTGTPAWTVLAPASQPANIIPLSQAA